MAFRWHRNLGAYQLLLWPRWKLAFWRHNVIAYRWVVYLWPIELRRFHEKVQ